MIDNGDGRRLFKRMQAEGIFAPSTYWMDVNLREYVQIARVRVESGRGA